MAKENPCEGCFHYYGSFRVNRCCNYIFDADSCRGCPAGAGCSKKISESEARKLGMRRRAVFTV